MKQHVTGISALALALCLLLAACGGQGALPSDNLEPEPPVQTAGTIPPPPQENASAGEDAHASPEAEVPASAGAPVPERPEDADLAEDITPALEALEKTEWQIVSTDAETFNLEGSFSNPNFEYVHQHTDSVALDRLIAFVLEGDAATEGADCELRDRFVEAPNAVLAYLVLMGEQSTTLSGWEPRPTAELVCYFIATADAAFYGGTEEFSAALAACRENYPTGRIAALLDVMEREHAASMERNQSTKAPGEP